MSWESLPIELRSAILAERYKIRNEAAKTIQIFWEERIINYALNLEIDENNCVLIMWESTAEIMEYCSKSISGKYNFIFWKFILDAINLGLIEDYHWVSQLKNIESDRILSEYYYRIKTAYNKIYNKFNS